MWRHFVDFSLCLSLSSLGGGFVEECTSVFACLLLLLLLLFHNYGASNLGVDSRHTTVATAVAVAAIAAVALSRGPVVVIGGSAIYSMFVHVSWRRWFTFLPAPIPSFRTLKPRSL